MEEEAGFEPADPLRPPVFKTGAIDLSATLPYLNKFLSFNQNLRDIVSTTR